MYATHDCLRFSTSYWKWELLKSHWLLFDFQSALACDFDGEGNLKRSYGFSRNARFGEYGLKAHALCHLTTPKEAMPELCGVNIVAYVKIRMQCSFR